MKLHTHVLPQVRQLLAQNAWFTPALVVAIVALEWFGRQWTSDVYDLAGAGILGLLVAIVAVRHRVAPLRWVKLLGRAVWEVARFADRFKIEFGPDLRGDPPIPRRLPLSVYGTFLGLAAWSALALITWYYLPQGWRSAAIQISYVGYLSVLIVLWGALFTGLLTGIYFPFILFNQLFPRPVEESEEPRMSRGQVSFLTAYLTAVIVAYWFIPLWVSLAISGAILLGMIVFNCLPDSGGIQFIWRSVHRRAVWSISTRRLILILSGYVICIPTALIVTAAGGHIYGSTLADASMPITTMLGVSLAWLTPGMLVAGLIFLYLFWRHSPSRPVRRQIYVHGDLAQAVRPQLQRIFAQWGWDLHLAPENPAEVAVCIRLVEPVLSQAMELDPSWPLCVSLEDLNNPLVRERLERRDEIQKRRLFLRGMERLFKATQRKNFTGGSGYWLAPHLWFMPGLTRDEIVQSENEEASMMARMVGPAYHELLHRHVRAYVFQVLRALQVDLIFVEDGVDFRKFRRVLRAMFEIFDKSAGKRRLEEVQLQGLPKVRVIIHDFHFDEPFRSEIYPEPRFDDLGRARILHIFRDRGEDEEYIEPPFDFNTSPVPLFA